MNRKILLWFDVEDYVTPESEDALYELLKMLKKSGVKATLKLCVKKYEQLLQNGRVDILDMMHDHEMSFHMTDHSVHPVATEYLDYIISMKTVASVEEAIAHINKYNTKHSEAIITENMVNAEKFLNEVDAACVYVNASTRFTDGSQFGFGAEIGISTQMLHARGPMGLRELTSYKYTIKGNGQIRD